HELGTSILSRVVDRTTSHVPAGTVIPPTSPEEIAVTRPDRNVVTKTDRAAKRKASPRPEISTNTAKRTRLSHEAHAELSRDVRRTTRASSHVSH
ncbi:hypothetical protein Tco_0521671, partial [Tanacetum coccineum]